MQRAKPTLPNGSLHAPETPPSKQQQQQQLLPNGHSSAEQHASSLESDANGLQHTPTASPEPAGQSQHASSAVADGPLSSGHPDPQHGQGGAVNVAVAVFGPESPVPLRLWSLPRSAAASVHYVPPATALHTRSTELTSQVAPSNACARCCCPLHVLPCSCTAAGLLA